MILLYQILKNDPYGEKMKRFYKSLYASILDPSSLHSSVTELFLELLYNALKNDYSLPRQAACLKRLLINAMHAESSAVISVLIFVKKVAESCPGLNQLLINKEIGIEEEEEEENENGEKEIKKKKEKVEKSGDNKSSQLEIISEGYDFLKLDPLFAKGDTTCLWEIFYFTKHYHPLAQKLAQELLVKLDNSGIKYEGNPLLDFSLASFLQRFSMKRPKTSKLKGKENLIKGNKISKSRIEDPFSIDSFLNNSEANVRPEEKFMFDYFKKKVENLNYKEKLMGRREEKKKERKKI